MFTQALNNHLKINKMKVKRGNNRMMIRTMKWINKENHKHDENQENEKYDEDEEDHEQY